jgi:hypothetical protein
MDDQGHGLEKYLWTDADFDRMGWHDCYIHAFTSIIEPDELRFEFLLDIDYIVRWVVPDPPTGELYFWVAPATLVFLFACEIAVELYAESAWQPAVISLQRVETRPTPDGLGTYTHWVMDTTNGRISLWAPSFMQYIRKPPIYQRGQVLGLEERGGVSFEQRGADGEPASQGF